MKNLIAVFILFVSLPAFVNCSPKTVGSTTETPKEQPAYTVEQMDEGKLIWRGACTKCHKAYEPASHTRKQWGRILPKMTAKAKLTDEQSKAVYAYIMSGAAE